MTTSHQSAIEHYQTLTPGSQELFDTARTIVSGGVSRGTLAFQPYPFYAADAGGATVTDIDGNEYLDLVNNYTSLPHGHGHRPTNSAFVRELSASSAIGTAHPLEAAYALELAVRYPPLERLHFTTTGSEAAAFALRVARANTGRHRVLKFEGGFHGSHNELYQDINVLPALAAGTAAPSRPASAGLEPTSTVTAVYNDPAAVADAFGRWGSEIAAVIVEPFLGNGSLVTATRDFLDAVFEHAHRAGALVVFDEIQSLRAGYSGASGEWGYRPDLMAIGKIMGGGFALAAFGGRAELFEVFSGGPGAVLQTGTFTAAPPVLAGARAAMAALTRPVMDEMADRTDRLREGLRKEAKDQGVAVHVNGVGSMFNIAFSNEPIDSYQAHRAADAHLLDEVRLQLVNHGVVIMPRGTGCLSTPVTDDDVERVIESFGRAVSSVRNG
ncbi:aminotransferase class III-fold pyridoxal phosphate-dependent enzyme [Kribbella solani]|uniref:aspartate aminotransferase family protein n=1 Tax=Kribbella solani TaxID=236067 RepID=UPI0029B4B490|nr:aminotransferase class III-fold pyridoxal phosphate-dependent enzyme [Kribbella solani]MDX3001707.1 aminotransferase class III-fold pyridoxal phosphate-dependent enzyme [Kribbella solani]